MWRYNVATTKRVDCRQTGGRRAPRLHELLLGAFRANDVFGIRDEASADQRRLARGADETIVVPMAVLERDESGAANSCTEENTLIRLRRRSCEIEKTMFS